MTRQASLIDPADDLTQILGADLAKAFLDHRKMLKKPMTAFAGQLMAKKLRGFPDPVAAVEQAILKGWSDVYAVEAPRQALTTQPRGMDALEQDLRNRIDDHQRRGSGSAGERDDHPEPVQALPLLGWESQSRPH